MADILTNKCPNCGGAIEFDTGSQNMKCPFCEAEFEIEAVKAYNEAIGAQQEGEGNAAWDTYTGDSGSGDWSDSEKENMSAYSCQSCGGEIVADKETGATSCPYCGNPVIIPVQFSGMFKPDYVIPFKIDKQGAKNALSNFLKGKFLLPKAFKDQNRIEKITGLYVPYWLFDCHSDGNIVYKANKVSRWSTSDYNYTKTDYYSIIRQGDLSFVRLPVDGSSKVENNYTEAIEPYNYNEMTDFQTAYLTGFIADKYDVEANECVPRANERIRESTKEEFLKTIHGYSSVNIASSNINISQGNIKYAMLPVWILNSKYKDKLYTFAMNGQTGKFVGELPVDWAKFFGTLFGITAGLGLIVAIAVALFMGF